MSDINLFEIVEEMETAVKTGKHFDLNIPGLYIDIKPVIISQNLICNKGNDKGPYIMKRAALKISFHKAEQIKPIFWTLIMEDKPVNIHPSNHVNSSPKRYEDDLKRFSGATQKVISWARVSFGLIFNLDNFKPFLEDIINIPSSYAEFPMENYV